MENEIQIGKAIRHLRKERQITLEKLGELASLSCGHLSQIERGLADPSLNALKGIANAFGIPLTNLLLTGDGASLVQDEFIRRRSDRMSGHFPGTKVNFELIGIPKSTIQMLWVTAPPGACVEQHRRSNPGEECAIVLCGKMRFFMGNSQTILGPGDAVFIQAFNVLHGWENAGDEELVVLWVVTPPF